MTDGIAPTYAKSSYCMAEQAGLEPATNGIKIRCTTFVLLLNCFGGLGWICTTDTMLFRHVLYSLSYQSKGQPFFKRSAIPEYKIQE
jgi:hypothetical protein